MKDMSFNRAGAGDLLLPVGFRFHPTEEELISYYLQMKLRGMDYLVSDVICEINMCDYEPWDLPALSLIESDNEEWYFFNRPIYKKNCRNQTERATNKGLGFWKITGRDKIVYARDNKTTIGKKRILTFHRGLVRNAQKTNWVMHEFYIPQINPNANQRDFVLCHVKKKPGESRDVATNNASDFENQPQPAHNMDVEEEHTQPPRNRDIFQREMDRMLANTHANNDYNGLPPALEKPDENSEEFLKTLIVDPNQDSSEEITLANVFNYSTLPQSIWKVYEDGGVSSDSDTEVKYSVAQCSISPKLSEPPVGSSHSTREKGVMLNQISRQAASSINILPKSQTDRLQSVTDEHSGIHQRTSRLQREARPINALKLKNASAVNWKGFSLISWETSPPLTSLPSVYLFNTILGATMFIVFAWEVVSYGQWC